MTNERQTEIYLSPVIFEQRQERFIAKINAMLEYAEQNQIKLINFLQDSPNEESYITDRLHQYL